MTVFDLIVELSKIHDSGKLVSLEGETELLWASSIKELDGEVVIENDEASYVGLPRWHDLR